MGVTDGDANREQGHIQSASGQDPDRNMYGPCGAIKRH